MLVDAGGLDAAAAVDDGAAGVDLDSTVFDEGGTVAKTPPGSTEVGVGFESEGTE